MTYLLSYSIAVTCLLGVSLGATELPTAKPEDVGLSSATLEQVREVMRDRVKKKQIPGGVVAIARHGKLVFLESYGQQNKDTGEPMRTDSLFRLYSMSKAITTAAAMMLVDEGKIALDDPVSKYLLEVANWKVRRPDGLVGTKRPITIRDLMLHTSGMELHQKFDDVALSKAADSKEFLKILGSIPLALQPGEDWIYSRTLDVLGLVIEEVSGKRLADFLDERLFKPLGMVDTAFYVPVEKRDRFAMIYARNGNLESGFTLRGPGPEVMELAVTRFIEKPNVAMGGIGLVGTAEDYLRFVLMIANGGEWDKKRYLSPKSIRLMTTNQLPDHIPTINLFSPEADRPGIGFGLGFSVVTEEKNFEDDAPVGEIGWGGGACTHYWARLEDGLAVVTMEQVYPPINRETRSALRPLIYGAVIPEPAGDGALSQRDDVGKEAEQADAGKPAPAAS